jgi:hypothetical protein
MLQKPIVAILRDRGQVIDATGVPYTIAGSPVSFLGGKRNAIALY